MKALKIILISLAGLFLLLLILFSIALRSFSESEMEEERKNVEGSVAYKFKAYPKAFDRIYEITQDFPNIHQLRFFDDGRISFYIKHCQEIKKRDDYCFVLELNDTTQTGFSILGGNTLFTTSHGRSINTASWAIYFTAQKDHPDFASLLSYLNISEEELFELKDALDNAHVDVHESTRGYTKNNSMAVFGVYSMLASVDYIIPLHDDVDVSDYTKLDDRFYWGDAPNFSYYTPD